MNEEANEKELSIKHKTFIEEYFSNGFNAKDAYKAVYPKASEKSCLEQSSILLKKVKNTQFFSKKNQEKSRKTETTYEENLRILKEIRDAYIEKFREKPEIDSNTFAKVVNEINKMEGNHAETKIKLQGFLDLEHSGKTQYNINIIKGA